MIEINIEYKAILFSMLFLLTSSYIIAQEWVELSDPLYGDFNGAHGDAFGRAVSLNSEGNIIAVGDPSSSKIEMFDGRISVFKQIDGNWQQLGQEIYGEELSAFLGGALALNGEGNILLTTENAFKGTFSVYELFNNEWIQKGNILSPSFDFTNNISVSINEQGDCVAVLGREPGFPIVYSVRIYLWNPITNDWMQKGNKISMQERDAGQNTNGTIELSSDGNIIIIGNPNFKDSNDSGSVGRGRVDVLYWNNGQWTQKGEPFIGEKGEKLGHNVNISADGKTILMGAPLNDNFGQNTGEIRLYHWINDSWIQKGDTFTSIDSTWNSHFASSMNSDGNIFAFWSNEDTQGGGVQVYQWKDNAWEQVGSNILKSLDGDGPRNNFISMNASGCKIAVGVPYANNTLGRVETFELRITKEIEIEICLEDTIYINDTPYFEEGSYTDTLHSIAGCDTILFLHIKLEEPNVSFLTLEACQNNTVFYEGQELEVGFKGEFNYLIPGQCDSIVYVDVVELESYNIEEYEFICKDSFLLFNDEPISAGSTIEINLESHYGCDSIILIHVKEYEYSSNFLNNDIQICDHEVVLNSLFTDTKWSNGDIGKSIKVFESGSVHASYINEFGCQVRDTVNVQLENAHFFVPNIFNPNSSEGNECFQVLFPASTIIELFQLKVYDRWGNLVWETRDSEKCWNGTYRDTQLTPDVFVWHLQFKSSNCNKMIRKFGDVTLIK